MARGVLRALEQAAVLAGRSMLMLDTRAGDSGERLYRAAGWQEYGRIPGHAVDGARLPIETVFFFKRLG